MGAGEGKGEWEQGAAQIWIYSEGMRVSQTPRGLDVG